MRLSREVSRGLSVDFFLGSGGPNCFRFRQIPWLLGPNGFNGFSPADARPAASAAGVRGFQRRLGAVRLSREVSRGLSVDFFLGSGGPNCFRFRQIPWLLGPNGFNGFSPVDARPEAWRAATRRRAARSEAREKRREDKGASPSSPSWMARRDGPWRV